MPIDLPALWDHTRPAVSEQRFRDALPAAAPDERLILQTQIARTYGIRRDFARARQILDDIAPQIALAGPRVQVHYQLELGRTLASTTHGDEQPQDDAARQQARVAYQRAIDIARDAGLDALQIDALHMMAMVDTAPEDQLRWGQQALAVLAASTQPDARAWEGSLRNNTGYALQLMGRYDDALQEFRLSLAAREQARHVRGTRIAHWMIARTLHLMGRLDEAAEIQLRLEREWDADGQPDRYVFEELEAIYRAQNQLERAAFYAQRLLRTP